MAAGPIVERELRTAVRRGRMFRSRCMPAALVFTLVSAIYGLAFHGYEGQVTVRQAAELAWYLFGLFVVTEVFMTLGLVPGVVAGLFAEERERRTLGAVLLTRLGSAEIVLGKLASGLLQAFAALGALLPLLILLPVLGGIDPALVLLTCAGTASTAYAAAGLSLAVGVEAPRRRSAVSGAFGLVMLWVLLPLLVQLLTPRVLRRFVPWVLPINQWLLASSPAGVLLSALRGGGGPGWRFFETVYWMMALELAGGSLLIAWSIARLRPASRRLEEGEASGGSRLWPWLRRVLSLRFLPRPACGADPVLWKELHTQKDRGPFERAILVLIVLVVFGVLSYLGVRYARPAFQEWFEYGLGPASSDVQREKFNGFLRVSSSILEFFVLLIAAGIAAEGVATERARDTWDSLILTPLDGREILRAKTLGVIGRVRPGLALLLVLWMTGLATGALHPLGFLAAVLVLAGFTWFAAALGTHASLVSRDIAQASNRALIPTLLLMLSFLGSVVRYPGWSTTVLLSAGSAPFVSALALLSYRDVGELMNQGTYARLAQVGVATGEGPLVVLLTWLIATAGSTAAAALLSRRAAARFDVAVGRPFAPRDKPPSVLPTCQPAARSLP